jgi:hypothetical protein
MAANAATFTEWVERNSGPPQERPMADFGGQPVVSSSKLLGPSAGEALAQDRMVQEVRADNNDQLLHEALASSPATGCAMVMSLAIEASGYNPSDPTAAGNFGGFMSYVTQLLECPVFSVQLRDEINPVMSSDWGSVINQIASLYVGIAPDDMNQIEVSLSSLAQAASSTPGANETETLFVQNALNAGDSIVVYMYWSYVQMVTNVESGGKNSPDTVTNNASLTLYRNILTFDTAAWPGYAAIIMPKTSASLQSWLNDNTTPQGSVPVNWNT